MKENSAASFIQSQDPLSKAAIDFLLAYKEEDTQVDYKESLDLNSEKEWLGLTKDVMAFANTIGGYLVFGVKDSSFDLVGLDYQTADFLQQTDKLQQKINRHVDPAITTIRAKGCEVRKRRIVVIYVPESIGLTHMISKNGVHVFPSGEKKTVLREGTIFIRRSGGNKLVKSRDLDSILQRRIDHFKSNFLSNIARIVEAPPDGEVFVLSQDPSAEGKRFIIENGPDAIKVQGMSFTVTPSTLEEEIAGCIALFSKDKDSVPRPKIIWKWYLERHSLQLTKKQCLYVASFCLLSDVPIFFWIQGCTTDSIQKTLLGAIPLISSITRVDIFAGTAAFLGKAFFKKIVRKLQQKYKYSTSVKSWSYPSSGPRSLFSPTLIESLKPKKSKSNLNFKDVLETKLQKIAKTVQEDNLTQPSVLDRRLAQAIDCHLYAQDNRYKQIIENRIEAQ